MTTVSALEPLNDCGGRGGGGGGLGGKGVAVVAAWKPPVCE